MSCSRFDIAASLQPTPELNEIDIDAINPSSARRMQNSVSFPSNPFFPTSGVSWGRVAVDLETVWKFKRGRHEGDHNFSRASAVLSSINPLLNSKSGQAFASTNHWMKLDE